MDMAGITFEEDDSMDDGEWELEVRELNHIPVVRAF
jgi:hypothetical protein